MFCRSVLWSVTCAAFVALGCGGAGSDHWSEKRPPTYPVEGKVLYNGNPVADAGVSFRSVDGNVGAAGQSDENGVFQLTTFSPGDGAVAGEHQVTVIKAEVEGEDPSYYDENSPNYGKEPPPTTTKYLVPEKYSRFETSGLTVTVEEEETSITLELKD